jgi:Helix-turn-helix.
LDLFSERINKILTEKKISQNQLAYQCDLTWGEITRFIKKERIPSEGIIIKIAYYLDINPAYLDGECDDITLPNNLKEEYLAMIEDDLEADNRSIFSKRLRSLVKNSDKYAKQIAAELNISKGVLSSYVVGRREPDLEMVKSLSVYFNVSTDYLLGLTYSKNYKDEESINTVLLNILKEGGFIDILKENPSKKSLIIKLLKHTCETFKIIEE